MLCSSIVFKTSPLTEPDAQFAISSIRCWMDLRIAFLDLTTETVQKRILEIRMIPSTIKMILVESLFFDATKCNPPSVLIAI